MMQRFRNKFSAQISPVSNRTPDTVYDKLTRLIELETNFLQERENIELESNDKEHFEIWEAENQMAEIEAVAKDIRQKIVQGALFKDFTVLVGDVEAYAIPVQEIFDLYEIPFFLCSRRSHESASIDYFLRKSLCNKEEQLSYQ